MIEQRRGTAQGPRLNIGMLIVSFLPGVAYGGVAAVAAEQARELAGRGHRVTVITTDVLDPMQHAKSDCPREEFVEHGYRVVRFPSKLLARRFAGVYSSPMMGWLWRQAHGFDIFHVHYGRGLIPGLPVELLIRRSANFFLQPHGMLDRLDGPRAWLDAVTTRRHLSAARQVFVLQSFEQSLIRRIAPAARSTIVPNGIPQAPETPRWPGPSAERRTVLFLARLHPRKRVLAFLSAAENLLARHPELRFRIVGPDGGDEERARRHVRAASLENAVEFVGPVSRTEALREYTNAAVYVLPTENENFSISVLEALMVGTPTVVTTSTRNLDVLRSADAVQVSAPEPQALSQAIESLLQDPALCSLRSNNGRRLVREQFTISRVVDVLESHFQQVDASR